MSVLEAEKQEIAALTAKLEGARTELKTANDELNALRTKVAKYADLTPVEELEQQIAKLKSEVADGNVIIAGLEKRIEKQDRELVASGPARALVAAINAVKA